MKRVIFATPWSEIPCKLHNVFQDTIKNLTGIKYDENKTEIPPHNINYQKRWIQQFLCVNTMIIQAEAANVFTK